MNDEFISPELHSKIALALGDIRRLVGDFNFTVEEKDLMKHEFARIWDEYVRSGSTDFKQHSDYLLTAALIVTIAKDSRGDWHGKEFWGRINSALGEYTPYEVELNKNYALIAKITNALILKTGDVSGRVLFKSGLKSSYVQTFLFQSYAPSQSINAYVRLLWSLFASRLFDYQYIDQTDKELCERIVDNLARLYSNDPDSENDIEFNGKTYQIRAGLRYAFAQDKVASTLLTRRILNFMNKAFRLNEDISLDAEADYLASIVSNNLKAILTPAVRKAAKRNKKLVSVNDVKAIHASYFLEQQSGQEPKILLFVNGSRLSDEFRGSEEVELIVYRLFDNGTVQSKVNSIGEILSSDFIPTFEELSADITKFFKLPMDERIHIQAVLKVDGEEIYDSIKAGDDLDRSFLLFKGNKEIRGNCRPDFYTMITTPLFDPNECFHLQNPFGKACNYAYTFVASDGDRITTEKQSVFFGFKRKDEHYYWGEDVKPFDGIQVKTSSGLFTVYKSLSSFNVHVESEADFENLWIEDSSENDRKIYFPKDIATSPTRIEISPKEFPQYQPRSLRVVKKQPGRDEPVTIFEEKYFIDPTVSLKTNGICLYTDEGFSVRWHFDQLKGTYQFAEKEVTSEGEKDQWGEYNPEDKIIEIPFENGSSAIINVPYFRWSFDDQAYSEIPNEKKVWIGDIHSGQIINIDTSFEIEGVYIGNKKLSEGHAPNSFLLGDAVISGKGLGPGQFVYAKAAIGNQSVTFKICEIVTQPELTIDPFETIDITEDDHLQIFLSDSFIGPEDSEFEYLFTDAYTEETFKIAGRFCLLPDTVIEETIPDGEYLMTLKCTFQDPKNLQYYSKVLYHSNEDDETIVIGNPDKFLYRGVSRLAFSKTRDGSKNWIKFDGSFFIDHIQFVKSGESHPTYKGVFHSPKSKGSPVFFDVINPEKGDKIRMFYSMSESEGEELVCYSVDNKQRRLVAAKADNQNLFRCLTIYCDIEEE